MVSSLDVEETVLARAGGLTVRLLTHACHVRQIKLIFSAKNIANYELYGTLSGETIFNPKKQNQGREYHHGGRFHPVEQHGRIF
ncbi:hypothetical protein FHW83_002916 [Duganella sp. SG902]|nr:hypothetical protein [Duganella sp. SG902]